MTPSADGCRSSRRGPGTGRAGSGSPDHPPAGGRHRTALVVTRWRSTPSAAAWVASKKRRRRRGPQRVRRDDRVCSLISVTSWDQQLSSIVMEVDGRWRAPTRACARQHADRAGPAMALTKSPSRRKRAAGSDSRRPVVRSITSSTARGTHRATTSGVVGGHMGVLTRPWSTPDVGRRQGLAAPTGSILTPSAVRDRRPRAAPQVAHLSPHVAVLSSPTRKRRPLALFASATLGQEPGDVWVHRPIEGQAAVRIADLDVLRAVHAARSRPDDLIIAAVDGQCAGGRAQGAPQILRLRAAAHWHRAVRVEQLQRPCPSTGDGRPRHGARRQRAGLVHHRCDRRCR